MVYVISVCCLPAEFMGIFSEEPERVVKNWHMFFCVASGLWGGLVIGLVTEYYTSNRYAPVQVGAGAELCGSVAGDVCRPDASSRSAPKWRNQAGRQCVPSCLLVGAL